MANIERRMSKKVDGDEAIEFQLAGADPLSSPALPAGNFVQAEDVEPADVTALDAKYSPEFLELAQPKLPALAKSNRGRLLMQSPDRLYFYWSVGKNPFHTLNRALGQVGSYTLVLRLTNLRTGLEELHPVDAAGNWWFSVAPDGEYRAEIGFYAANRPYIRVLRSNTVATPRKSPSPRTADTAEWRVPAEKFARVLDAAGFARDAFDVAMVGDDVHAADLATRSAFAQFSGRRDEEFQDLASNELRYAMLALASGIPLAELRGLVSDELFSFLSSLTAPTGEKALSALQERFEFDSDEFEVEEEKSEPVFAGSLVNFPRRTRKVRKVPEIGPISSHNFKH